MNKLELGGATWIAADIHLGPQGPETASRFYGFLKQAERECDALILCGDIFNAWVGDDQIRAPEPWLAQAMQALRAVSRHKKLYLMRGNRDFLLGERFAHAVGATLLPDDGLRLQTPGGEFWLTHGDELCTDDHAYQRFRRLVRNRLVQRVFLACPLAWRLGIARYFRRRSQQAGQYKSAMITDVNEQAWQTLLERQGLNILVHGHTHRPAIHRDDAGGLCRIVLPDWEADHSQPARYGWLCVDASGLTLHQAAGVERVSASQQPNQ